MDPRGRYDAPPQEVKATDGASFGSALFSNEAMVRWVRRRLLERPRWSFLRRRWGRRLIAVAHFVSLLLVLSWAGPLQRWWHFAFFLYPVFLAAMLALTSLLHASTFGLMALRERQLDERQVLVRGRAHRTAHWTSVAVLIAAVVATFVLFGLQEAIVVQRSTTVIAVGAVVALVAWMPAYVLAFTRLGDDVEV